MQRAASGLTPKVMGAIEFRRPRAPSSTLAVLQAFVPNEGSAWSHARAELGRFFERALTRHRDASPPGHQRQTPLELAGTEVPDSVREAIGLYLDMAALIGRRTAEMHLVFGYARRRPQRGP